MTSLPLSSPDDLRAPTLTLHVLKKPQVRICHSTSEEEKKCYLMWCMKFQGMLQWNAKNKISL